MKRFRITKATPARKRTPVKSFPARPEHRILRRIADSMVPISQASLLRGFKRFRGRLNLKDITAAINAGDFERLDRLVPYDLLPEDLKELERIHRKGIEQGGEEATKFFRRSVARIIPTVDAGAFAFNPNNPAIQSIIRQRTANLVTEITQRTRNTLKEITEEALRRGLPPRETAKLVERTVGLTSKQALAVERFQERLVGENLGGMTPFQRDSIRRTQRRRTAISAADVDARTTAFRDRLLEQGEHDFPEIERRTARFRLDATRRGAVEPEAIQGLSSDQIDRTVDEYVARQYRVRAEAIARTETFEAVNRGQLAVWDQASDEGLYDRGVAQKEWVVTDDERLCPICAPLQGVKVGMDDEFQILELSTSVAAPPAHPRCRCHISLDFGDEEA